MHDAASFARVALVLIGLGASAAAHASDPVVAEAIGIAKANALNGASPIWLAVEQEAGALIDASPGEAGRTAAIRHVLASLRDGHSSYRPPATANTGEGHAATPTPRRPVVEATVGETGFPRLAINGWTGNGEALDSATQAVRRALNDAVTRDVCGLVLDVTGNDGGNMWPMMGGIAPLYDDGTLVTFEDRNGLRQVVNVRDGALRMGENIFPRVELEPLHGRPAHIAILLGGRTASSGEILAMAFRGQANVRFFGEPTVGATTANRSFRLSNGGQLALTTASIRDRAGNIQRGPLQPDVRTNQPLIDAQTWLAGRCGRDVSTRSDRGEGLIRSSEQGGWAVLTSASDPKRTFTPKRR